MAAIDKIYVNTFEEYKLFKDWCEQQPKIKDKYGTEGSLTDYLYGWGKFEGNRPIFMAPYYIDAYLIRNCPFDFIQDELKFNYGYKSQEQIDDIYNIVMNRNDENKHFYTWLSPDDFKIVDGVITMPNEPISDYELIKERKLYATPYTQREYIIGDYIKCIKHPSRFYNTPFECNFWWIQVDTPDELGYMWYHEKYNSWDFIDEFVISDHCSSTCIRYKSIRAVKRAIRKWNLPVGSIVTCSGKYIGDTYKFKVVKK